MSFCTQGLHLQTAYFLCHMPGAVFFILTFYAYYVAESHVFNAYISASCLVGVVWFSKLISQIPVVSCMCLIYLCANNKAQELLVHFACGSFEDVPFC